MAPTYDVSVNFNSAITPGKGLKIGVLALQGDVREHLKALADCGATAVSVRRPSELAAVDGLIIPGGESTTMDKLSRIFGLREPLRERIQAGLPVYGSCAGMILLANEIADPATDLAGNPQQTLGGLDITVRRNAFGRQVDSFETELDFTALAPAVQAETPMHAVFIRAPWVERVGAGVQVLASVKLPEAGQNDRIDFEVRAVAVRSRHLLATSFHPEVTGERRIHELFIRMIRGEA
ncbi:pyridoxal 5'-phosphate synthase glutaminase subunit PdxT [Arthrobacter psychrochitiniphilus]|uniref:Pyridoxal 5'-phosphate synthase subunit PdxT n=1 Tax=Arthrobacter psychrochitiniphilus TaxID=291045 RepID=A0A2V3DXM6_9MICC|nr:pyridoxal 5'-phosphate synthase glutaminase subunit PdxT [Arthrobacter psychrochitiniphilus]PXA65338.1 pyridoxal 5'-phosphate synthase glutaminase subunit PdxT [Arthrobacter psychrochitiniphilus]